MSNVHHYDNTVESCGWPVTPLTIISKINILSKNSYAFSKLKKTTENGKRKRT